MSQSAQGQDHKLSPRQGAGGTHSLDARAILQMLAVRMDRKRTDSKQTPAPTPTPEEKARQQGLVAAVSRSCPFKSSEAAWE